jgi:hypothetical protein
MSNKKKVIIELNQANKIEKKVLSFHIFATA